jgi:hypothetical protein
VGDPQALLKQRREALFAEPLAPARQRRAVEGQLVPEHMLAAEILKVGVLDPAGAERFVAQRMHVLEDEQTRHQTDRQRRLAVAGRVNLAQPPVEEAPVDLSGQPHQRMAHVDDPLQHRPEQVRLPIVPRPRHSDPRSRIDDGIESETGQNRNHKSQEYGLRTRAFLQKSLPPRRQSPLYQPPAGSSLQATK